MDEDEVRFLLELRETTQRTLRELKLQRAAFGLGVPSHITLGIKQAEKDIALLDAKLQTVQPSQAVADAVGPIDTQALLLDHRLKQLGEKVSDALTQVTGKVGEISEQVVQLAGQVTEHKAIADERYEHEQTVRVQRQEEHDQRLTIIETGLDTNAEQIVRLSVRINWVRWLLVGAIVLAVVAFAWVSR